MTSMEGDQGSFKHSLALGNEPEVCTKRGSYIPEILQKRLGSVAVFLKDILKLLY